MSRSADITLFFGDGEHKFRLAIAELRELQEKTDAGPPLVLSRLFQGQWRVEDVRETLRLGLIGGGMKPADAHALVVRYCDERPAWGDNARIAAIALAAAISGAEDEPVGKPDGEGADRTRSPGKNTASGKSTAPARSSGSRPAKSTK